MEAVEKHNVAIAIALLHKHTVLSAAAAAAAQELLHHAAATLCRVVCLRQSDCANAYTHALLNLDFQLLYLLLYTVNITYTFCENYYSNL